MPTAEKFVLFPKKFYMKNQPDLEDPDVKQKSAQLYNMNLMQSKQQNEAQMIEKPSEQDSGDDVAEENWVEQSTRRALQVLET